MDAEKFAEEFAEKFVAALSPQKRPRGRPREVVVGKTIHGWEITAERSDELRKGRSVTVKCVDCGKRKTLSNPTPSQLAKTICRCKRT
jgi:hypothetical protein